jgi:hypothetical protein
LSEGLPQLTEVQPKGSIDAVGRGGEANEAVEFIAVLSLMDELNAARAIGAGGEGGLEGEAVWCSSSEEGEEAGVVTEELVEVGHLRWEGRMVGASYPSRHEGGLISDRIDINFDRRVDDIVTSGCVYPGPLPRHHL